MSADRTYTDAEILAHSNMSWWEYEAREGSPTRVAPAHRRIERGPGSYVAKPEPVRDFLSEPIDYLEEA